MIFWYYSWDFWSCICESPDVAYHIVHNIQLLKVFLGRKAALVARKTKYGSMSNMENGLIYALSCIELRISMLCNNRLNVGIDCSSRCVFKCCFQLFLFLFCACATFVALEQLYSRWATDPLFV